MGIHRGFVYGLGSNRVAPVAPGRREQLAGARVERSGGGADEALGDRIPDAADGNESRHRQVGIEPQPDARLAAVFELPGHIEPLLIGCVVGDPGQFHRGWPIDADGQEEIEVFDDRTLGHVQRGPRLGRPPIVAGLNDLDLLHDLRVPVRVRVDGFEQREAFLDWCRHGGGCGSVQSLHARSLTR